MNGKKYMSSLFRDYGLSHIFYMETICVSTMIDLEKKYGVKPVLAHSEMAAGYMADGYARSSQKPGVAVCQSIGSANMAAALHDAWLANSPVIAITGYKEPYLQYRNAYQESDHRAHFSGVTKFNAITYSPEEFPHLLKQCFREVTTGVPQPAHLDIPGVEGVATERAESTEPYISELQYSIYPAYRPYADFTSVKKAADAVNSAKKPIIVAGRGVFHSDKEGKLVALAKKAGIPVATTPDAKTIIDERDEFWAGIVGRYGMNCANQAVSEADLVIYIGSQTSDLNTMNYTVPDKKTKVIQIDINGAQIGKNYPDCIGLQGDALRVIEQLEPEIDNKTRDEWRTKIRGYLCKYLDELDELANKSTNGRINAALMCREISKALPDDAILVSDTGWSAVWSVTAIRMKESQNYYRAAGTLGWAFPASMGVKCANPDKPVVCFIGDGGMFYYFTEFETAIRNNINTVTIMNNNGVYAQNIEFDPDASEEEIEAQRKLITFSTVNFADAAKAFGAYGVRVEKIEDLGSAINGALAAGKPALIEVMTDWRVMPK